MHIRPYDVQDWTQLWPILETVLRSGETYAFSPDISEDEAQKVWTQIPKQTLVMEHGGQILGSYYIRPNQPSLASHVCNCGYVVAEQARGQGIASRLCEHSQQLAIELGFLAMQFNLVVSTNHSAIHLWKKHGFEVIGTLPKAFNSNSAGFVDALVMYKWLGGYARGSV